MAGPENVPPWLGVEIGGTKLQAAVGDGAGRLLHLRRVRALPEHGREGICEQVRALVQSLLDGAGLSAQSLAGAAIGFGGPVDAAGGRVVTSHQVAGWSNFPLIEWFEEEFGIAARLANDSDCAGLAEAHFGAGRGASPVVYMNIGSGIGGAFVLDGALYQGQGLGAAEIGHLRLAPAEPGQPWRTLEGLASGWQMAEAARRAADRDAASLLWQLAEGNRSQMTTEVLVEAVRRGDPTARRVWDEAIEFLGVAVANVITLLHPARFVLGGGVSAAGELLLEPLRSTVQRQVFGPFANSYQIVPAALGEEVVLHGALKLAREAFGATS